jgi:hypothetical protein
VSVENMKRIIALLIGVGTITVGLFTWRAGQIGSAAAFDDRTAVGQQVDVENARIDIAVEAARQARQYDLYLSQYAIADELDADAADLRARGEEQLADVAAAEAVARRQAATVRASEAGVFGADTLAADPDAVSAEPAPFDLETRIETLTVEETTGLDSAGDLDPQQWADDADDIRDRIRNLTYWVGVLLIAVVLLTAAEVTLSRRIRRSGLAVGVTLIAISAVGGFTMGWAA